MQPHAVAFHRHSARCVDVVGRCATECRREQRTQRGKQLRVLIALNEIGGGEFLQRVPSAERSRRVCIAHALKQRRQAVERRQLVHQHAVTLVAGHGIVVRVSARCDDSTIAGFPHAPRHAHRLCLSRCPRLWKFRGRQQRTDYGRPWLRPPSKSCKLTVDLSVCGITCGIPALFAPTELYSITRSATTETRHTS